MLFNSLYTVSTSLLYSPYAIVNSLTHTLCLDGHRMSACVGLTPRSKTAREQVLLYHFMPKESRYQSYGRVLLFAHPCPNLLLLLIRFFFPQIDRYCTTVLSFPNYSIFIREKTHSHHLMMMARRLERVTGPGFLCKPFPALEFF